MALSCALKNFSINTTAVTDAASGDGVTGLTYGDAHYLYLIKELLVALGWTVTVTSTRTSGTGNVANNVANSDQWTSAFKVAYQYAYCGLKSPTIRGVTRRILLQRADTYGGYGRFKVNATADYNLTSATATQPKTISGEYVFAGGGTDASPTFDALFPTSGSFYAQGLGYTAENGGFAFVAYPTAGSAVGGTGFMLALDPYQDSTYPTGSDDAAILCAPGVTPATAALIDEASGYLHARSKLTLTGAAWGRVKMQTLGDIPLGAGSDPYTSKRLTADVWYTRNTAPQQPQHGKSTLFRWFGSVPAVPATGTKTTTRDRLIIGPLVLPWDGSVVS